MAIDDVTQPKGEKPNYVAMSTEDLLQMYQLMVPLLLNYVSMMKQGNAVFNPQIMNTLNPYGSQIPLQDPMYEANTLDKNPLLPYQRSDVFGLEQQLGLPQNGLYQNQGLGQNLNFQQQLPPYNPPNEDLISYQ